ncbi:ImmA/IrrE family metallo-endopeptidase [Globicatella sanguinis]
MRNQYIYDKVNRLVKNYKTRNPEELINTMNIKIQLIRETKSLLGMYKVILNNRFIFLPTNVGDFKYTILAHELGHDQLHRAEAKNGLTFHDNKIFNPTNVYEMEANIFACHLLIPDEDVLNLLRYADSDIHLAGELGVDINLLNLKISEMAKLGLLDIEISRTNRPASNFLKNYNPQVNHWDI